MNLTQEQKDLIFEILEHYGKSISLLQKCVIPFTDKLGTHKLTLEEELDFNFAKHQVSALRSFTLYFEEMLEFAE